MDNKVKKVISLELPESLKKLLQQDAASKDMSVSALIRHILKLYYKVGDTNGKNN